jgi:hypothetical protein
MPSLNWTLNRLRLMEPAEIRWRIGKALKNRLESMCGPGKRPPTAREDWGKAWLDASVGIDPAPYCRAADAIMDGRYDIFAMKGARLGFPPRWNQDPKTGTVSPLRFGKTLDYRDESLVGEIKYLWELNRHYELVTLAQAYRLSGYMKYANACRDLLSTWIDQCPYPLGVAWSSSLENGIRLLNWSAAWSLLGGPTSALFDGNGACFRSQWLSAIHQHCRFIAGHLSRHSSANNHLFGEYMGLFAGAVTWPCWPQSAEWKALAREGLEREALLQNHDDGVNREQAIWYHHEVADMMLLCLSIGQRNGIAFSRDYCGRLEGMLEFIAATMDVAGNVPMIGDSDDALMVRFCTDPCFEPFRSLLATGAALFARSDFKRKARCFDVKSRWLTGDEGAERFESLPESSSPHPPRRAYPQGGYYILGKDFDTQTEVRIVADAGSLGYLSICAHGHADALSFTLSAGGRELLIDPGTYAYHTQKAWRDYFRGTSAHNTVRIDGMDQSEPGGNFMWLRKAEAVCESWNSDDSEDVLVARHDGYMRLHDPVLHVRRLHFLKAQRMLMVEDRFSCKDIHQAEFMWHFGEECDVRLEQGRVLARSGNVRLEMQMPEEGTAELMYGSEQPPSGWVSRRYDEKCRSPSIALKAEIGSGVSYRTFIHIAFE